MSEENQTEKPELTEQEQKDYLKQLKKKADQIGVSYSPNIGLDTLRKKINDKLEGNIDPADESIPEAPKTTAEAKAEDPQKRRVRLRREAAKLVRVRITCMNPQKRDYQGEIFTVGNTVVGNYRRMVPFGVDWHVPQIMLNMIRERKYQQFRQKKDPRTGTQYKESAFVPEFAVEVLPALNEKELKALAQRQAMADGTEE